MTKREMVNPPLFRGIDPQIMSWYQKNTQFFHKIFSLASLAGYLQYICSKTGGLRHPDTIYKIITKGGPLVFSLKIFLAPPQKKVWLRACALTFLY